MNDVRLETLDRRHDRESFDCGEVSVTRYLRQSALQAQETMRASTKVAVPPDEPKGILGYFTLTAQKIVDTEMPEDLARLFKIRNLCSGAPAVLLAQLGVAASMSGRGLGTFLLHHALRRALSGALEIGGVALVVDAVDAKIAQWYVNKIPDFRPISDDGLRLIIPMRKILEGVAS